MRLNSVKSRKITSLCELNKYKDLSEKQSKIIKHFTSMYNMASFVLFTVNAWRENGVEIIEYSDEIWINQEHLQEKLYLSKIYDRTQYYSDKF